jgi:hypothetical protein
MDHDFIIINTDNRVTVKEYWVLSQSYIYTPAYPVDWIFF